MDSPPDYFEELILVIPLVWLLNNSINHLCINVWDLHIIYIPQYGALVTIYLCICHKLIVHIGLVLHSGTECAVI